MEYGGVGKTWGSLLFNSKTLNLEPTELHSFSMTVKNYLDSKEALHKCFSRNWNEIFLSEAMSTWTKNYECIPNEMLIQWLVSVLQDFFAYPCYGIPTAHQLSTGDSFSTFIHPFLKWKSCESSIWLFWARLGSIEKCFTCFNAESPMDWGSNLKTYA